MRAEDKQLTKSITGNNQFIIPVFQRDYCWTEEQCKQLWEDVMSASDKTHFLGSIVYVENDSRTDFQSWLVIDGQQRLTTITLLLIAIRDHIDDVGWEPSDSDSPTSEKLNSKFLKNQSESDKDRMFKLVLRRKDNDTLRALVENQFEFDLNKKSSQPIVDAYVFFRQCLQEPGVDLDDLYRNIGHLDIVDVKLEQGKDNPQLVFESMNSTGVDLNQSDLIRNYLLMGMSESEQTQLYDDYWSKIELSFLNHPYIFDLFLRDYVALKTVSDQQAQVDAIYDAFKEYWAPSSRIGLEDLLTDMVRFARYYASFSGIPSEQLPVQSDKLSKALANMRSLHTTQGVLAMRLFDFYKRQQLTLDEFIHAVTLIESYVLRRDVIGLETRSYWKVFTRVAHRLDDNTSVLEALKVAFARLDGKIYFPTDEEFKRSLQEKDLYTLRVCRHILDQLENAGQKEPSPVSEYSIEHIMPVKIENVPEWQRMLGNNWQSIHNKWLNRLGNLTLTAYNSEYWNHPFERKKEIDGGFNESAVRLNEYVRKKSQWTANEIKERGKKLTHKGLKIWPHHHADEMSIQEAEITDLRNRAETSSPDDIEMSDDVRQILNETLEQVQKLVDVIVVTEQNSVCCYRPRAGVFAELSPMKNYLRIYLPLEFNELDDQLDLYVEDVSNRKRVQHRTQNDFNLLINYLTLDGIEPAMHMIRQSFDKI